MTCPRPLCLPAGRNKLAGFGGQPAVRLVEAIKRASGQFSRPPIGPLGVHLALEDPTLAGEGGRGVCMHMHAGRWALRPGGSADGPARRLRISGRHLVVLPPSVPACVIASLHAPAASPHLHANTPAQLPNSSH